MGHLVSVLQEFENCLVVWKKTHLVEHGRYKRANQTLKDEKSELKNTAQRINGRLDIFQKIRLVNLKTKQ